MTVLRRGGTQQGPGSGYLPRGAHEGQVERVDRIGPRPYSRGLSAIAWRASTVQRYGMQPDGLHGGGGSS